MTILGLLDRLLPRRPLKASSGGGADAEPALSPGHMALLDRLTATAYAAGLTRNALKIAAILGAPGADANRAFACTVALSGLAREEAEQAIAISLLTSQPTPTGEDGISRHH